MREVDGSEGGGQLLRTALALSAVSGEPVTVTDVRGARPDPGLGHQHLAALRLLAEVTDAEVAGDEVGAETVEFDPGGIRPGTYEADIGTAGSVTLLFDAVLPLAVGTPGPIRVTARGGTDVKWSPTMAHYRGVKLPLLRRAGLVAAVDLDRTGYYPKGGGEAALSLAPSTPEVALTDRGEFRGARVHSAAARDLEDADVGERQADAAADALEAAGLDVTRVTRSTVAADCPGSSVAVRLDYEDSIAGFDNLGERGKPAEEVGEEAAEAAIAFDAIGAAVDGHTADQLLPFVGLRGGRVLAPEVTDHVRSSVDLLAEFGHDVSVEATDGGHLFVAD